MEILYGHPTIHTNEIWQRIIFIYLFEKNIQFNETKFEKSVQQRPFTSL